METMVKIMDEEDAYVAIPLKEYKDLLMIKGKYEELKSQITTLYWPSNPRTNITYTSPQWHPKDDERKVTCAK